MALSVVSQGHRLPSEDMLVEWLPVYLIQFWVSSGFPGLGNCTFNFFISYFSHLQNGDDFIPQKNGTKLNWTDALYFPMSYIFIIA